MVIFKISTVIGYRLISLKKVTALQGGTTNGSNKRALAKWLGCIIPLACYQGGPSDPFVAPLVYINLGDALNKIYESSLDYTCRVNFLTKRLVISACGYTYVR